MAARTAASRRFVTRDFPYSVFFDGAGDWIDMGDVLDFERTDAFSVCGYFYATSFGTTNMSVIRKAGIAGNAPGWSVFLNTPDRCLTFFMSANAAGNRILQAVATSQAYSLNQWYFWGVSYSGSSDAAGVQFVLVPVGNPLTAFATKAAPLNDALSATTLTAQPLRIGASSDGSRLFFGWQQKVSVFSAALTLADFQNIYYNNAYPSSLIATWLGEDAEGFGTTASDEVGSFDGTLNNAIWSGSYSASKTPRLATRQMPNSLFFNSTSDNVEWSDNAALDVSSAMTAEAWVTFTGGQMFMSKYGAAGQRSWYANRVLATGLLSCAVIIGGVAQTVTTDYVIPFNVPFHVVMTYDGAHIIVYANGREVGRLAATGSIDDSTAAVRLGRSVNSADSFSGYMHLFRYWGVAATRAEVRALYYGAQAFGTPILECLMTDGSGGNITSTGSYAVAGTTVNVDWTTEAPFKTRTAVSVRTAV